MFIRDIRSNKKVLFRALREWEWSVVGICAIAIFAVLITGAPNGPQQAQALSAPLDADFAFTPVPVSNDAFCKDSDRGDITTTGVTTIVDFDNNVSTRVDTCEADGQTVVESSCSANRSVTFKQKCAYGCLGGRCLKAEERNTVYVAINVDTENSPTGDQSYNARISLKEYEPGSYLDQAMSETVRLASLDSFGTPIKFTWYQLAYETYCFTTPSDCLLVHNQMERFKDSIKRWDDGLAWHYHSAEWYSYYGSNETGGRSTFWNQVLTFNGKQYMHGTDVGLAEKFLSMQVLEKSYYPAMLRIGWAWMNNDLSRWIDGIIPYDYVSNAPLTRPLPTRDPIGNVYDWSRAPQDWSFYHPSTTDYQVAGDMKHYIFRCMPDKKDFPEAFANAQAGKPSLVCVYTHTYNDPKNILTSSQMQDFQMAYPGTKFAYVNGLEGVKKIIGYRDDVAPTVTVQQPWEKFFTVLSNEPLFAAPYAAVQTTDGSYIRVRAEKDQATFTPEGLLAWTFDLTNVPFQKVKFGGTDIPGNAFVTPEYHP